MRTTIASGLGRTAMITAIGGGAAAVLVAMMAAASATSVPHGASAAASTSSRGLHAPQTGHSARSRVACATTVYGGDLPAVSHRSCPWRLYYTAPSADGGAVVIGNTYWSDVGPPGRPVSRTPIRSTGSTSSACIIYPRGPSLFPDGTGAIKQADCAVTFRRVKLANHTTATEIVAAYGRRENAWVLEQPQWQFPPTFSLVPRHTTGS